MTVVTVGGLLEEGAGVLRGGVEFPRMEAGVMLRECLGVSDRADLHSREGDTVDGEVCERFRECARRRGGGLPLAYVLERREFYGLRFRTTPAALIPRPETEELTETALAHLPEDEELRVLDLGTGCGAIGLTVAKNRPRCDVLLADVAEAPLALARENARRLGAANARFRRGDWFEAARGEGLFAAIVCNPPYIADGDPHLTRGDLRFEPGIALRGGGDGLRAMTTVINGARRRLMRGGVLLLEHGRGQAAAARELFAGAGFCGIRGARDLAGLERMMFAVNP